MQYFLLLPPNPPKEPLMINEDSATFDSLVVLILRVCISKSCKHFVTIYTFQNPSTNKRLLSYATKGGGGGWYAAYYIVSLYSCV